MFSKYDEEEETVPLVKNEMDPSVKDYLMKKNNLGNYSDQARQGVTEGAAPSGLDFLSSALGAVSAGFGGRDPMAAQQAVMRGASERGERDIASFDKGRANQVQEMRMDRDLVTQGREDEKYGIEQKDMMDERDASSKISMAYQQQLKKMQPNMDVSGMSASDIKGIMNPATKVYDMEQRALDRNESRQQRSFDNETKKIDKQEAYNIKKADKKEVADTKKAASVFEVEDRVRNINGNLDLVMEQIKDKGTYEVFGEHNKNLDRRIEAIAVDMAKLADPNSVARPSEVESFKKGLIETNMASMRNSTATNVLDSFRKEVAARADNAYKVRGLENPNSTGKAESKRKAKKITQGGVEYILNENTGEYE